MIWISQTRQIRATQSFDDRGFSQIYVKRSLAKLRWSLSRLFGTAIWVSVPVDEDPLSGPVKILILTTPQGPQKAGQPQSAKEQSCWYEIDERRHDGCTDA